ncbi:lipase family protein [Williamsia sp. CHRR-6]|uniref:lipase family protein n=1 Tax=Williamsia sp. CHRR-6 TaxID=2835871 RepID=UPI001BD9EBD2|nr:lipase family protein [Williamsia sp. CHRR-6]MBT0565924.1 lipase [Williamsia sp. CHRR-6]
MSASVFSTIDRRITDADATAYRIRYVSQDDTGRPTPVTGVVAIPNGPAPEGGWPVVAFNHGNTGTNYDCGPSLYDGLLNQVIPIAALLMNRFAVVASDYAGLGGVPTQVHAFLNAPVLGRNVIDGVRAARSLRPDLSTKWAAFGGSLGGLATWAANEQAASYGSGLKLVGAAAWVPVVNTSLLPEKAMMDTLTKDQRHLYFLAVTSMKLTTHPEIELSDYLRGSYLRNRELLRLCVGPRVNEALSILDKAKPADLVPSSDAEARQMKTWLDDFSVPKVKMAAPMFVVYGSADKLVDQQWVETALRQGCALGDTIEWQLRLGEGHGDIQATAALPWVRGMFEGRRAVTMCDRLPPRS